MADPEAHPLSKLLRASHTVTGQNQCMVHAHGVCALGALVYLVLPFKYMYAFSDESL